MSVAIARAAPVPTYPFSGDADEYDHERVDWGTATPINSRTVIELEDDFSYVVSKRGVKRKAIPETGEQLLPRTQKALLLREVRQPFALAEDHQVPEVLAPDEVIIRIQAIGLNPIDWKSADYGYGIPELPYVSGRDFAGTVVKAPATKSHLRVGDTVRSQMEYGRVKPEANLSADRSCVLRQITETFGKLHIRNTQWPQPRLFVDFQTTFPYHKELRLGWHM